MIHGQCSGMVGEPILVMQSDEELYYDPHMLMSPRVNPYFSDYKDAKHFLWKALQKCKTSIYFNEYE